MNVFSVRSNYEVTMHDMLGPVVTPMYRPHMLHTDAAAAPPLPFRADALDSLVLVTYGSWDYLHFGEGAYVNFLTKMRIDLARLFTNFSSIE